MASYRNSIILFPLAVAPFAMATGECIRPGGTDSVTSSMYATELFDRNASGHFFSNIRYSSDKYYYANSLFESLDADSIERQRRYSVILRSFEKRNPGFAKGKMPYILYLANVMQNLPFIDAVSDYDESDDSVYSYYKLPGMLSLSVSQYLDNPMESDVVFSIHRNKELLVSSEMNLEDLRRTVNEIVDEETAIR